MTTKTTLVALLLTLFTSLSASAQNNTFFMGHVYSEDSIAEKQIMIPFATLKIYSVNNPDKIVAIRITGLNGSYDLKGFNTDSTYIVKVKAPGLKEQSFVTKPNNGRVKSGNLSTHPKLATPSPYESPVKKQSYTAKDVSDDKDSSVAEMVAKIPGLTVENGEISTAEGGSVRLMINGFNPNPDLYAKIKDFPASEVVKTMDYYNLSEFDGSVYDGVLNIRIAVGNEATAPDYKLVSLKEYKIESTQNPHKTK